MGKLPMSHVVDRAEVVVTIRNVAARSGAKMSRIFDDPTTPQLIGDEGAAV